MYVIYPLQKKKKKKKGPSKRKKEKKHTQKKFRKHGLYSLNINIYSPFPFPPAIPPHPRIPISI